MRSREADAVSTAEGVLFADQIQPGHLSRSFDFRRYFGFRTKVARLDDQLGDTSAKGEETKR